MTIAEYIAPGYHREIRDVDALRRQVRADEIEYTDPADPCVDPDPRDYCDRDRRIYD